MGRTDFSDQFRKNTSKRIGCDLNVMRQSAWLVINPIMVDNFAALFNCIMMNPIVGTGALRLLLSPPGVN